MWRQSLFAKSARCAMTAAVAATLACATTTTPTATAVSTKASPPPKTASPPAPSRPMSTEAARATIQAELALVDGDVAAAVEAWRAAVRADDASPYLSMRLGEGLLLLGDAHGAADAAARATSLAADDGTTDVVLAALRLQAQAQSELGDDDASVRSLREVLRLRRGDAKASALLADRLVANGDLDGAEAVVDEWMKDAPGVEGTVALGRVFAERGLVDRALSHLSAATRKRPDDVEALLARRTLLSALGRYDDAVVVARALLAARGDGPETRSVLLVSLALANPDEARATGMAICAEEPGERSRMLVADAFERGGLVDDAVIVLRPLLEEARPSPLVRLELARLELSRHDATAAVALACAVDAEGLGEVRLADYAAVLCARATADAGDVDGALERLDRLTSAGPPRARPLQALASVLKTAPPGERKDRAIKRARDAVTDERTVDADVVMAAASVLVAAEKRDEAKAIVGALLQRRPADRDVVLGYARVLDDGKNPSQTLAAVELVERLVDRRGADVDTLNFMAFALAETKQRATDARAFAWRAVLLEPENGYVVDTLGWSELQAGDACAAAATLRRADRLTPNEGEVWFHIASAEHACGHADDARAAAARADALLPSADPLRERLGSLMSVL